MLSQINMAVTNLSEQLIRDEGIRRFPYEDSVGKLTIGVGRNLNDVGLSADEIQYLLTNDIQNATQRLEESFPWTATLDDVRRGVLLNMTFNMGIGGLAGFKQTLAKIQGGDFSGAAQEMLQSKWAEQVGPRAQRLAVQLESGSWQ